jgi:hypothetical protein
MPLLVCSIAILAVTVIYLFWRSYLQAYEQRQRALRERVAYLLWILADAEEEPEFALSGNAALDNPVDVFNR